MDVSDRPRIGISSCLLGERVRWDGGHKRDSPILDGLGAHVEWMPVCPEVEIGLGTPREPIELIVLNGRTLMITVEGRRDLTETMGDFARAKIEALAAAGISGYVLKKKSPSCDPDRGLFARALRERLPDLPVEHEEQLHDPDAQTSFVERARAYRRTHHV